MWCAEGIYSSARDIDINYYLQNHSWSVIIIFWILLLIITFYLKLNLPGLTLDK